MSTKDNSTWKVVRPYVSEFFNFWGDGEDRVWAKLMWPGLSHWGWDSDADVAWSKPMWPGLIHWGLFSDVGEGLLWTRGNIIFGEGVNGELGITERDDGPWQVTYNQKPLYFYIGDFGPGDVTGHSLNDAWFVAAP